MNNQMKNDTEFTESVLTEVREEENGWAISSDGGWLFIPKVEGVKPEAGMTARYYGRGFGSPVRGVLIDGKTVYYRTAAEDKEHHEILMYGADAADWLKRWDEGKGVWSIEMGGLGPGYEQCIHITCAEILRELIARKIDFETPEDLLKEQWNAIEDDLFKNPTVSVLGLSGAQFGAAKNLAALLHRQGPRGVMKDERLKDRHIQVSKNFPGFAASA